MIDSSKPEQLSVDDFSTAARGDAAPAAMWSFEVKSYHINFTNSVRGISNNYAAGILITDNVDGATGNFQRHAVLKFFWDPAQVPVSSGPNPTGLLHLNYSVADYVGILDLLKSSASLRCFYKPMLIPGQSYGGIIQIKHVPR
jgi:hypothetical protein